MSSKRSRVGLRRATGHQLGSGVSSGEAFRGGLFRGGPLRRLRAGLVAAISVVLVGVGVAPSAQADPPRTTAQIISDTEYSPLTSSSSISGAYVTWKGTRPTAIDWSTDGCSLPSYIVAAIPAESLVYSSVFKSSCVLHDFGYRNYGSKHHYDRTRSRKNSIDSRFVANMRIQCGKMHWYDPRKPFCGTAANAFYYAVSHHGDKAFFG